MERRCPDTLLVHTDRNGGFLALVRFLNTYYGKKEVSQCWTAFKIPASNTPISSLLFPTIYKMSLPTSFGFPNYKSWPNKRQIRIWAWQIVIILLRLLLSWKKPSTNNRYLLIHQNANWAEKWCEILHFATFMWNICRAHYCWGKIPSKL